VREYLRPSKPYQPVTNLTNTLELFFESQPAHWLSRNFKPTSVLPGKCLNSTRC